ncbi:MAG TPA: outer membrane protein transport protein [Planctomycetaceae bacterium]|jgi:long-subunit fatty acid transport protein|nr:outer membrane protein transport protein [Planctomycetaceae bacterium]
MNNCFKVCLVALVVSALSAKATRADGVIHDSVEAISDGRGGTNIAFSDNGGVLLANPAGILNGDGCGLFEVGGDTLITDLHYSNPINPDTAAHIRPLELPMVSYFQKSENGNWAWGFGVFAPAGFAAGWDLNNPVLGNQSYKSFGSLVKFLPGLAWRPTDRLSIGATFGLAYSYEELETPFFIQQGPAAGAPTLIKLVGDGVTYTWSVGAQYKLTDTTMLGAAFTSEDRFSLDGHMDAQVFGLGPGPVGTHYESSAKLNWPATVGIGIKQDLTSRQRVSLDVVWVDWADAFRNVGLELSGSSNPIFTGLLGPAISQSIPLNWWDSVSVRTGYEWFYSDASVLRLGYTYNSVTIPSSTLTPWIPGILEHTFAIGWGTRFENNWRLDLAYQFSFGPERSEGTSAIVGGDFSNSTFDAQVHWISVALTHTF